VAAGERPRSNRDRNEAKVLSPAQVHVQLRAVGGQRNEVLYVVAVHLDLGEGELLGLKWTDVDLGAQGDRRGSNPRPSEPQSRKGCFRALLDVAESA
jgi:hypothetical protein